MHLKKFMFFWVYLLPLPLLFGVSSFWFYKTQSLLFVSFLVLLPTLYGYIVPGIGINFMKKWKFHSKWTVCGMYPHHGFKYASNINLVFFLVAGSIDLQTPLTLFQIFLIICATGIFQAVLITIHDILSIKTGTLEVTNIFSIGTKDPKKIVFKYAPGTFFIIGATFASMSLLAYKKMVVGPPITLVCYGQFLLLSFVVMVGFSSFYFAIQEWLWRKYLKKGDF